MITDEELIVGRDRGTGMSRSAPRSSAAGRPGRSASACREAPRAWLPRACHLAVAGSSRAASRQRARARRQAQRRTKSGQNLPAIHRQSSLTASPYRRILEEFLIAAQTGRQGPARPMSYRRSVRTEWRDRARRRTASPLAAGRNPRAAAPGPARTVSARDSGRSLPRRCRARPRGRSRPAHRAMSTPGVAAIQRSVRAIARVMRSSSSRRDCSSERRVTSVV